MQNKNNNLKKNIYYIIDIYIYIYMCVCVCVCECVCVCVCGVVGPNHTIGFWALVESVGLWARA